MNLVVLKDSYAVCQSKGLIRELPKFCAEEELFSVSVTKDEVSIICREGLARNYSKKELGWKALKIKGCLDFDLVGIISKISTCLAEKKISIFTLSTFNTDYILIKEEKLPLAIDALKANGYAIE